MDKKATLNYEDEIKINKAIEVFGSEKEAEEWLYTFNVTLNSEPINSPLQKVLFYLNTLERNKNDQIN